MASPTPFLGSELPRNHALIVFDVKSVSICKTCSGNRHNFTINCFSFYVLMVKFAYGRNLALLVIDTIQIHCHLPLN
jgi:hypothetical protein